MYSQPIDHSISYNERNAIYDLLNSFTELSDSMKEYEKFTQLEPDESNQKIARRDVRRNLLSVETRLAALKARKLLK